jgi:hypothetical protein
MAAGNSSTGVNGGTGGSGWRCFRRRFYDKVAVLELLIKVMRGGNGGGDARWRWWRWRCRCSWNSNHGTGEFAKLLAVMVVLV